MNGRVKPGAWLRVVSFVSLWFLSALGSVGALRAQDMAMNHGRSAAIDPTDATFSAGANGIVLGTGVSPAVNGRDFIEGYLTQPMVMGVARFPRLGVEVDATLNLEGATLQRGELNPGIYGEGYVDRRHPHTYLHELVGTWKRTFSRGNAVSASVGKGFAPFGTDDPMARPFVTYPVNHHLAQILERAVIVGAASVGPATMELARFNGDEPQSPWDLPNSDRLFDSWAGRATARFWQGSEIQTSFASVISPEVAAGGGLTQKKWSVSGRYESEIFYGLAEWARTEEYESRRKAFAFQTMLAEGRLKKGESMFAGRVERTERPEEERLGNPFRTPRPANDLSIFGRTRWTVVSVSASHSFDFSRAAHAAPFIEVERAQPASIVRPAVFDPKSFYGSDMIWSLSIGVRFGIGMNHQRMGRYGAAVNPGSMKMTGMEMAQ